MSADVLITDDRLSISLSLADFLRVQGLCVCVTSEDESLTVKDVKYENKIGPTVSWNRNSIFSTQSLWLQLKNLKIDIETAVIIFDTPAYTGLYANSDVAAIEAVFNELIIANIQLLTMLMDYFMKKKSGKLVFVHREIPSPCAHIPIAAASSAFVRLAEEIAASCMTDAHAHIQTMLVRLEGEDNESYTEWIGSQIQTAQFSRNAGRWIKAGQRGFFTK